MALKAGILGAGYMGGLHGRNLAGLRGVTIEAICSLEGAQALSDRLTGGKAAVFTDFDAMLKAADLDVLYVCLPPGAHSGQVEKAARRGIHVFMEKPIAIEPRRAASIVRAIEKAGVVSQVGYMSRFGTAVKKLKKMIDDGAAGRPTLFQARYFCNALHSPWWRHIEQSGGQVLEQVIHTYDAALHLFGDVKSVCGMAENLCHTNVDGYNVEDTSAALLRFANGALGSIVGSNCAVPMEWTSEWRVVCENVTVLFKSPNEAEFIHTKGSKAKRVEEAKGADIYLEETKNFLAAVRGTQKTMSPAREGLRGVKLTSAVLRSAAQGGKPVPVR
jgi:predicted dehydrogenase